MLFHLKKYVGTFCFVLIFCAYLNAQTPYYKWGFSYALPDGPSLISAIGVNQNNDVYVGGGTNGLSAIDFDPSPSSVAMVQPGAFLAKYDQNKNFISALNFSQYPSSNVNINAILVDDNDAVYVVGDFTNTMDADPDPGSAFSLTAVVSTSSLSDGFVIKLDPTGQFVWAKSLGGNQADKITSICKDASGNFYCTGTFRNSMDSDPGAGINMLTASGANDDVFVLKLDSFGNFVWSFSLGNSSSNELAVEIVNAGNQLLLFGQYAGNVDFNPAAGVDTLSTSIFGYSIFLAKYDLNSNFIKVRELRSLSGYLQLWDVCLSPSNELYLSGNYNGSYDADPSGASDIHTFNPEPQGFVGKYDTAFNYQWTISTESVPFTNAGATFTGVSVDSLNNIYVVGTMRKTVDFDPSAAVANITVTATEAGVICRYNSIGQFVSAFPIDCSSTSGTWFEGASKVVACSNQNYFVAGYYVNTVDLDPGLGTATMPVLSAYGAAFLAKYGNCPDVYTSISATRCYGTPYNIGTASYTETGVYTYRFLTASGCDSIVTLNLTVKHVDVAVAVDSSSLSATTSILSTYQWMDCTTNSIIAGATTKNYSPTNNDNYAVIITQLGCVDTSVCENIYLNANAGVPVLAWANIINNNMWGNNRFLKTDQDGNFYVTGSFSGLMDINLQSSSHIVASSGTSQDIFLTKYDNDGAWLWSVPIGSQGGTSNFEQGDCIYIDEQENVYLTGTFEGTMDFDPGFGVFSLTAHGQWDTFFGKYNSSGQLLWVKAVGSNAGNTIPVTITMDRNSNIVLSGTYADITDFDPNTGVFNLSPVVSIGSSQPYSGFIAKYTNGGNFISAYAIGSCNNGVGDGPSVVIDKSNNIIVSGSYDGKFDFDLQAGTFLLLSTTTGASDIYIAKYSSTMVLSWAKRFGVSGDDQAYSLACDRKNNIYLMGNCTGLIDFSGGAGTGISSNANNFIVKYDSAGLFQMKYPLIASGSTTVTQSIVMDEAENLYAVGSYYFDFNPGSGNITSLGQYDGFVTKYSNEGILQWDFPIASASSEEVNCIAVDKEGNVFIAGKFGDTIDFDPSPSTYFMTANPSGDQAFIAKYGQDCGAINTIASVFGSTITATETNSYYEWIDCNTNLVVAYTSLNSYSPSTNGSYKTIIHQGDCIDSTACFTIVSTDIKEAIYGTLTIYPNPASNTLYVAYSNLSDIKTINFIDVTGKYFTPPMLGIKNNVITIPIDELQNGMYFIEVITSDGIVLCQKFVKNN